MVYVDGLVRYGNRMWCHMMTDQDDLTELHNMAVKIGVRKWFQDKPGHPHYDLGPVKRAAAISNGAVAVTATEMVMRCSAMFKSKAGN